MPPPFSMPHLLQPGISYMQHPVRHQLKIFILGNFATNSKFQGMSLQQIAAAHAQPGIAGTTAPLASMTSAAIPMSLPVPVAPAQQSTSNASASSTASTAPAVAASASGAESSTEKKYDFIINSLHAVFSHRNHFRPSVEPLLALSGRRTSL